MPQRQPSISWQQLRNLTERWSWNDPQTGVRVTGFNVPDKARKTASQVPFHVRYITKTGHVESGNVICLKVWLRRHQRMVKFIESGQIRVINDCLVMEVDGMRIVTH